MITVINNCADKKYINIGRTIHIFQLVLKKKKKDSSKKQSYVQTHVIASAVG